MKHYIVIHWEGKELFRIRWPRRWQFSMVIILPPDEEIIQAFLETRWIFSAWIAFSAFIFSLL